MKQTVANLFVSPEEKRREEGGKGDYATWGFKRWDMQVSEYLISFCLIIGNGKEGWRASNVLCMEREDRDMSL